MVAQVCGPAHKCVLDVSLCMRDNWALAALVKTGTPAKQAKKYLKPLLENLLHPLPLIRGRGCSDFIIDSAVFSVVRGTGAASEVAAVL